MPRPLEYRTNSPEWTYWVPLTLYICRVQVEPKLLSTTGRRVQVSNSRLEHNTSIARELENQSLSLPAATGTNSSFDSSIIHDFSHCICCSIVRKSMECISICWTPACKAVMALLQNLTERFSLIEVSLCNYLHLFSSFFLFSFLAARAKSLHPSSSVNWSLGTVLLPFDPRRVILFFDVTCSAVSSSTVVPDQYSSKLQSASEPLLQSYSRATKLNLIFFLLLSPFRRVISGKCRTF